MAPRKNFKKPTKSTPQKDTEESGSNNWGKQAGAYYDEDSDVKSDSELDALQEEVKMIESNKAKRMRDADFELDDASSDDDEDSNEDSEDIDYNDDDVDMDEIDMDEDEDEDSATPEDLVAQELDDVSASLLADRETFDPSGKSAAQSKTLSARDAFEVKNVLNESLKKLKDLHERVAPLLEKIHNGELKNSGRGVSYLETKAQLLLSYLTYLAFYVSLRARGRSVNDHPVVEQMVATRIMLEKLVALDDKLAPQIDRIVARGDKSSVAPKPSALLKDGDEEEESEMESDEDEEEDSDYGIQVAEDDSDEGEDEDDDSDEDTKKYSAPRRLAVEYTKDHVTAKEKAEKDLERTKSRLRNSEAVRALREELSDAPEEMGAGTDHKLMNQLAKARALEQFEEDTFNRVKVTKAMRKEQTKMKGRRALMSGAGDLVEDLADIADDVMAAASARRADVMGLESGKKGKGAALGAFLNAAKQANIAAERAAKAMADGADELTEFKAIKRDRIHPGDEEDARREMEREDKIRAEKTAEHKKKQKERALKHLNPLQSSEMDKDKSGEDDKRNITYQIEKNKGLIRHRKKTDGNARVHNRQKFEKKVKARQVVKPREGTSSGRYDGETNIRPDLIKSKKMH